MTIHRTLLATAAALAPMVAFAVDISWYVGAGAGGTRLEEDLNLSASAFEYDGTSFIPLVDRVGSPDPSQPDYNPRYGNAVQKALDKFKGTDLGFRTFAGLRFGRFFGLEAGYVDLGEPDDEIELNIPGKSGPNPSPLLCDDCRPETDVAVVLTDDIDGWDLYALGAFPLNDNWEVFAKLGVLFWDSNFTIKNATADTLPPTESLPPRIPRIDPQSSSLSDDGNDLAGGFGFNYRATEHMTLRGEGTWYDIKNTEQAWLLGFSVILTY